MQQVWIVRLVDVTRTHETFKFDFPSHLRIHGTVVATPLLVLGIDRFTGHG